VRFCRGKFEGGVFGDEFGGEEPPVGAVLGGRDPRLGIDLVDGVDLVELERVGQGVPPGLVGPAASWLSVAYVACARSLCGRRV
jgi:hypothetical protein